MKYKVGDRVRVKKGLKRNQFYGIDKWLADMECNYITVDSICGDCYIAENNGVNWNYTDEMLDGLVEDEADVSEPTNAELIAAAEMLKANCEKIDGCRGCVFTKHDLCAITHCFPRRWEIPHRKTRTDLLLGKFPNILATRVPTSPELVGDGYSDGEIVYDTWICPNCKQEYEVEYEHYNFCPYCGQCIDWSIESEEE